MKDLNPSESLGYQTNLAARLLAQAIYRELRPLGVSPGQLPVFFALANGSALPQKALAQIASTEQPSMAEALSRMLKEGLIQRQADPQDGRSVLYSLTPVAMEKTGDLLRVVNAVNEMATSALTDGERSEFMVLLGKIIETMKTNATA